MPTPVRYFSCTDGIVTLFRQSPTRVYLSCLFARDANGVRSMGFSSKLHLTPGNFPCKEITKAEYNELVRLKYDRHHGAGLSGDAGSPNDNWVWNHQLSSL